MKFFRNSIFIVLLISIFTMSGCACNPTMKDGLLKGALLGALAGVAAGGVAADPSDDDGEEYVYVGVGIGAIAGGIIGLYTNRCPEEPVEVAQAAPVVDTDTDGDGVVDRLDQCPDTPKGVPVDYKGCPKDSDNDGVYDNMDKCPGTPKGVKVDSNGCPYDSDGDGVYDYKDKCPGTQRGVKVDSNGCPLDSDGDGIPDNNDKCPATPKGAKINNVGCWVLNSVLFDINKATIKSAAFSELDNIVDILNNQPKLSIELQGYTCSLGSDAYNLQLSDKRANAVKDYLISRGIDNSRVTAKGYGEANPIASNDTEEERKKNRRVRIVPIW